MAVTLAYQEDVNQAPEGGQGETGKHVGSYSMPPLVRALFQDLANIRMTALTESPQLLPALAPSLVEAEIHIRQLWSQY